MDKESRTILLSTIVTIVAILGSIIVQLSANNTLVNLKKYEVTFLEKQKAYSAFIEAISELPASAEKGSAHEFKKKADEIETKYYVLEPFLSDDDREIVWGC